MPLTPPSPLHAMPKFKFCSALNLAGEKKLMARMMERQRRMETAANRGEMKNIMVEVPIRPTRLGENDCDEMTVTVSDLSPPGVPGEVLEDGSEVGGRGEVEPEAGQVHTGVGEQEQH